MREPVFIHGLFRSGSTYLFDKFRSHEHYWCYYEPFHHVISKLDQSDIDIWAHSLKTSKKMNHPSLTRPHFYEYLRCFDEGRIKYFDKSLSYDRFLIDTDSGFRAEKNYIDHLIESAPEGCRPVLQFNRSTFRLKHFVDTYPDANHFFLLRNPRSQFQSYVSSGPIFLTLNLIIGARLINKGCELPIDIPLFKDESFAVEQALYSKLLARIKLRDHYKVFLYLWSGSLKNAIDADCKIIDMDKTNSEELKALFYQELDAQLEFKDYGHNQNSEFLLTFRETISAEKNAFDELIISQGSFKRRVKVFTSFVEGKVDFSLGRRFKYYKLLLRAFLVRAFSLAKWIIKNTSI